MVLNKTFKGICKDIKRKQYFIIEFKIYVTALLRTFISRHYKLSCQNRTHPLKASNNVAVLSDLFYICV